MIYVSFTYKKEGGAPLGYHSGSLLRYHYHTRETFTQVTTQLDQRQLEFPSDDN